jgi:hypothetical protein
MIKVAEESILNAQIPEGPIAKWSKRWSNKRKFTVIVVGTGLAGARRRPRSASWATTC